MAYIVKKETVYKKETINKYNSHDEISPACSEGSCDKTVCSDHTALYYYLWFGSAARDDQDWTTHLKDVTEVERTLFKKQKRRGNEKEREEIKPPNTWTEKR